ncbi:unnamed protein product [Diatraea saccharalis]|uniref:Uncharacterized protein n=1 Tax=Diatraea saccharalis TaxID=40085 RepID=A0A9N9R485_9NEOP|nr:unnamed protein product [Diatraea saccharalis]
MPKGIKERKEKPPAMLSCLARIKSIMAYTKDSMLPAYHLYADFCQETTLHGMKHSVQPRVHCCESWWSAFPAITACFIQRIDPEKARVIIETYWNVSEESDPDKYDYYQGFLELIADVSFRTNLQNFWKYQNDNTVKDMDLMELASKIHPSNILKVMVSRSTGEKLHWTPVMTEVGMCVSFNSLYAKFQHIQKDDVREKQSLQQFHYLTGQCYIRVHSLRKSVRYFIHSPYEIPTAISNPTGEVTPGEELVIDYKEVEIQASEELRQLRPDQRRCRYSDEWISDSIRVILIESVA